MKPLILARFAGGRKQPGSAMPAAAPPVRPASRDRYPSRPLSGAAAAVEAIFREYFASPGVSHAASREAARPALARTGQRVYHSRSSPFRRAPLRHAACAFPFPR
ncbi:hypothetical protein WI41_18050 [Burkholderia latens]|uniref:Uncharacterized protein n=1 Tax=Burkholderia latens TaxID=488446 RepID=A0AAP1C4Z7_9BURK|nr:hypothetical protein WI41_18050 [Burkholderia latens]